MRKRDHPQKPTVGVETKDFKDQVLKRGKNNIILGGRVGEKGGGGRG